MGETTGISWTDATWNPHRGCRKVSQGCKFCYMFREQERYGKDPKVVVRAAPGTFFAPLKWKEPRMIFTCSWSDWFIEEADAWRDEAWDVIRKTPQHTYQILTKRPERIAGHLPTDWGDGWKNVWLGVSAEDQANADKRIPLLLQTPAAVRFVSCEPLLGPVYIMSYLIPAAHIQAENNLTGETTIKLVQMFRYMYKLYGGSLLDWVICGGESGPGCRPMSLDWARSLRDQCKAASVAYFFKQIGGHPNKRHEPAVWPDDLRVQEFPR